MTGVISWFTRHRTAANLLLVLLIALGLMAMPRMRAQFFPDIIIDNVTVSVTWEGASAEDMDSAIVQLLEPALLADEADEPVVRRGAWRDSVTDVVITGPVGTEQLARIADEFVTRLFDAGVTRTTIEGVAAPETVVEVPGANLIAHRVTMEEIATAIAAEITSDPAGDMEGANTRVRTGTAKRTPDEIADIPLRMERDGTALTIGDVARIRVAGAARDVAYFVGDRPAISVSVARSAKGDALEIEAQVRDAAGIMLQTMPEGVSIDLIRTRSEAI